MTIAERIYAEAQRLPDEMAHEALDFILFLVRRYGLEQVGETTGVSQWDVLSIDTRNWQFDREEANVR
ncbi:MAG: hypothetical protein HQL58_10840 [Magnetococcales bacterium]|nr:hypothetical protein [Magnetococcales bacterium]